MEEDIKKFTEYVKQKSKEEPYFIFHVTRKDKNYIGYDEYISFVCVAKTSQEARLLHPSQNKTNLYFWDKKTQTWLYHWYQKASRTWHKNCSDSSTWTNPYNLNVKKIGIASTFKTKVICTDFNEG